MTFLMLKNKIKLRVIREFRISKDITDYKCKNRSGEECYLSIKKNTFSLKDKNNKVVYEGDPSIITKKVVLADL